MKYRTILLVGVVSLSMVLSGCVSSPSDAAVRHTKIAKEHVYSSMITVSQSYFAALRTADEFLGAWLDNRAKLGVSLLTKAAKDSMKFNALEYYFSGTSNPTHVGFEIIGFRKVNSNVYLFKVWMYGYAMGLNGGPTWARPAPETLRVIQINSKWYVDNLPSI
ncbi:MAG: hypothetical protein ACYCYO_16800 [Bacilli bacterium]